MSEAEDFEFRLRMEREAQPTSTSSPQPASMGDTIAGLPITRLAMGAASPLIGAAQLGAHVGDVANRAMGVEPVVSPWIDQQLARYKAAKERSMKAAGDEGFDWMGLLGSLAPTSLLAKGVGTALPAATSVMGRAGVGAVQGGVAGAVQPVENTEQGFWSPKGIQTAIGTAAGGAVPLVVDAAKGIGKIVSQAVQPFTEKGRAEILKEFQTTLMGNDPATKQKVVQALLNAKQIVPGSRPTSGEALAELPEATGLAAHQRDIARIPGVSPQFAQRGAEQEAARAGVLVPIARNDGALEGEKAIRSTITTPMRNAALGRANIAGREVPKLEAAMDKSQQALSKAVQERAERFPTKEEIEAFGRNAQKTNPIREGMPWEIAPTENDFLNAKYNTKLWPNNQPTVPPPTRDILRSSIELHAPTPPPTPLRNQAELLQMKLLPEQIAKRQTEIAGVKQALSGLEAQGMQPLSVRPITASIRGIAAQPELRASDVVTKSLGAIEDKLTSVAKKNGVIDAFDLYMIRKEAGNTIKKFAGEEKNFDQRLTSGLLSKVQQTIDDAIEGAGGKGWKNYLLKYQELSAGPNRMEAGQTLQKALTSPLETSERGQVFAKAIRDSDLSALTTGEQSSVGKVATELSRKDAFERLARGTKVSGSDAIPGQVGLPLPNILYRPAMVANFMLRHAGKGAEEKIAKLAANQYLNPHVLADSLKDVPPRYRPMIDALMQQLPAAAGTLAGRSQ